MKLFTLSPTFVKFEAVLFSNVVTVIARMKILVHFGALIDVGDLFNEESMSR